MPAGMCELVMDIILEQVMNNFPPKKRIEALILLTKIEYLYDRFNHELRLQVCVCVVALEICMFCVNNKP